MNQIFAPEYFDTIFRSLSTNKDLHSCLLVNKHWAACAVSILWEAPFRINDNKIPSPKVIKTYLAFIPDSTFLKLGYNGIIGLSPPLFFNYPSFLKELSYDQFLNTAIANNCCKDIIIELFKLLDMNKITLRRFEYITVSNNHQDFILPNSIFSRLTYFNCSYQWPMQKTQLFNTIANYCHSIKNLKVSICYEDEKTALADLIRSQRNLKKFTLINSNNFASFPVQALVNQKHSLNSLALEDMHCNRNLNNAKFFNYAICQLNNSAIDILTQCTKINKVKFKHCEGLNSSVFLPLTIAFPNLTSLEYSYGTHDIYDSATPIRLLSDFIMTSCNTLKRVILDWHSGVHLDITQLVEIIAQHVINLEHLKIPIYTLKQLALIHRIHSKLRKLEININKRINPYYALSLFANVPLKSFKHSIQLYFGDYKLELNLLNKVFTSIFYKSNRIVNFTLCLRSYSSLSIKRREMLLRNYPRLRINILNEFAHATELNSETYSDKSDKMLKIFDDLLEINSEDIWALKQRGATYLNIKKYIESLKDLNKVLEIEPNDAYALRLRGEIYYFMGEYENSLKDLNKSLEIEPNNAWTLKFRGITYSEIKRYEESLNDLSRASKIEPNYSFALKIRDEIFCKMKRYNENSLMRLNEILELEPNNAFALKNRGAIYKIMKKYHESLADLNKSLQVDPDDDFALKNRGTIYWIMKKYDKSLVDLNKILELESNDAFALKH
ncbi:hypothetical protein C2G38_2217047, partial [Gigaspora rosea]